MSTALIPGSFDPITLGHMDVITRAASCFDRVVVAVMQNDMHRYVKGVPEKRYMFPMSARRSMVEAACAHLPNVEVVAAGGTLVSLFGCVRADVVVKGVRNTADFEYEQKHAHHNRAMDATVETLYMPADPAFEGISSTLVRRILQNGEVPRDYVPAAVLPLLMENYG